MLILAFDTTQERGGAALYRDLDCLAQAESDRAASYSITLFEMVNRLLAETRLRWEDIELYAAANGPGSFTGIRVGLAAAQAWAYAFRRPVCGVSLFEAMVNEIQPPTDLAIPILDARRGEFFLEKFRSTKTARGQRYAPEGEGRVLKPDALAAFVHDALRSGATVSCLIRDHDQAVRSLRENLPQSLDWVMVSTPLLGSMARLALAASREGRLQSPAELEAFYVRRSDAELDWRG